MDLLLSFQRVIVTSTALSFSSVVARASAGRHVRVRHLPVGLRLGENHRRPAGCAAQVWPHPPPGGTYRVDAANGESVAERPGAGSSLVLLPLLCITDLFQGSRHAFGRGQQRRARQPLGTSRALQYAPAILEWLSRFGSINSACSLCPLKSVRRSAWMIWIWILLSHMRWAFRGSCGVQTKPYSMCCDLTCFC